MGLELQTRDYTQILLKFEIHLEGKEQAWQWFSVLQPDQKN